MSDVLLRENRCDLQAVFTRPPIKSCDVRECGMMISAVLCYVHVALTFALFAIVDNNVKSEIELLT